MIARAISSLVLLFHVALCGCNDADKSKRAVQPARTFPSPAMKAESRQRGISRPVGCGGNPYYFDEVSSGWIYFDAAGVAHPSPAQPPCPGAEQALRQPIRALPPQSGAHTEPRP